MQQKSKTFRNILVVQTAFLGDIILTTPLIINIKKRFSESRLTVLTTPQGAQLLDGIGEIEKIVVGLPLLLKGGFSKMTTEVDEFVKVFSTKTNIPIEFLDERLSSVQAERHLKDNLKLNRKKRSKKIDPMAATLLLQNFINF